MFRQWECGCVGISSGKMDGQAVILDPCDADRDAPRDSLTWAHRDMETKRSARLDADRTEALHRRLAQRLWKADRFDALRLALGVEDQI